jgi:DNA primase
MLKEYEYDQIDNLDVLGSYGIDYVVVGGDNAMFCCPFHGESNPSCGMSVKTGLWGCFACGEKGNILQFVAKMDGLELVEAEDKMRKMWIQKADPDSIEEKVRQILARKDKPNKPSNEPVPEWMLSQYVKDYTYMYTRGFTEEVCNHFNVVFDPKTGYQGIPIYDERGRLIGLSGRNTKNEEPRYIALIRYQKAQVVFNLDKIDKTQPVIVVEGEINCMSMYQHGYTNTVAVLGASIANDQIEILRNAQIKELIIFFDTDAAGNHGTIKLIQSLWNYMQIKVVDDHEGDPNTMTKEEVDRLISNAGPYQITEIL